MLVRQISARYSVPYRIAMFLLVLLLGLILYAFAHWIWSSPAELGAYNMLLRMRPVQYPSGNVMIVAVDAKSIEEQGPLPWSRSVYARITRLLRSGGAAVIAYDIPMPNPDGAHPGGDTAFAGAISGRDTILPMVYDPLRNPDWGATDIRELILLEKYILTGRIIYPADIPLYRYYYFVPPWSGFMSPARDIGVTLNPTLERSAIRSVTLTYVTTVQYPVPSQPLPASIPLPEYTGQTVVVQGLPLVTAAAALGLDNQTSQVDLSSGDITLASSTGPSVDIPVDRYGAMIVNYAGPAGTYPTVSAADLLNGTVDKSIVAGKTVLVGITDPSGVALIGTPHGWMPRVEVMANATDTVLARRFIVRNEGDALVVLVLLAMVLGLLLPFVDLWDLGAMALVIVLAYIVLGVIVLTLFGHAFPVIPAVLLILLGAVAVALLKPAMFLPDRAVGENEVVVE